VPENILLKNINLEYDWSWSKRYIHEWRIV